jgi:hypothetical protein
MKGLSLAPLGVAMLMCGCASAPLVGGGEALTVAPARAAPERTTAERMDEARRGVADAAMTPLKDVGLVRPEIPPVLDRISYPYETAALGGACAQVSYELGQLDATLGPESYDLQEDARGARARGMDAAGDAATDAVRGAASDLIPFRGLVRKASGADKAAKAFAEARALGQLRRAFLRGYGAALGCPAIMPPVLDRAPPAAAPAQETALAEPQE